MKINLIRCKQCIHRKVCMYVKEYYNISNYIANANPTDGFSVDIQCNYFIREGDTIIKELMKNE